jgi:PST family polysaccharide transporter
LSKNSSYNQIIKSTTIFGGSQIFIILIGIIRTKIVAILLGAAGIGIIGIYQSVIDMMRSVYSLGMDTAGVKEIAEADSKDDRITLYKTITRLNKWFKGAALLGLVSCAILSYPISIWVFEDKGYTLPIALLSICIFLAILSTGKSVILQGMRKIPEMAKSAMLGSLFGLVSSVPIYFIFGLDGIIPAFIISGLISFFVVEFYYRKQSIENIKASNREAFESGLNTLKLGLYIVVAGLISTISMFLMRGFITRNIDIEAAGLFQAAWAITNVYLGLILRSMGSDFFPHLSAIASDNNKVKGLVNEQSYIVLVIASPIIIGMLLFSDFALAVLYSSEFTAANSVLCWQIAGTFFKVLSWPIAFIMLAKNKGLLFFMTEAVYYIVYLLSGYLLYPHYGLEAAGIGYLIAYIVYLPLVFIIGYRISEFNWKKSVVFMTLTNIILICAAFYIAQYMEEYKLLPGVIVLLASLLYAYLNLRRVFSLEDLKKWFNRK